MTARSMRAKQVAEVCVHRTAYEMARSQEPVEIVANAVVERCRSEIDNAFGMARTLDVVEAPNAEIAAQRMAESIRTRREDDVAAKAAYVAQAKTAIVESRIGQCWSGEGFRWPWEKVR